MTDVVVTGAHGQLGSALLRRAPDAGLEAVGCDVDTIDVTEPEAVAELLERTTPRWLINCAAATAVDACEQDEALAFAVNARAPDLLAGACARHGTTIVHISTDYVFAGTAQRPYREDDPTGPRSVYGRSKLAGEAAVRKVDDHLIVRTAWLYGHGGRSFVEAIRAQVVKGTDPLRVVADQTGSPTYADDLAEAVMALMRLGAHGTVHAVNSGEVTWHGFAKAIVAELGAAVTVEPVTSDAFPRPAPRPRYSVLDTARLETLIGRRLPPWRDGLRRYLEQTCAS
jgi:dTDP-4-dehydrorhamnose reductase